MNIRRACIALISLSSGLILISGPGTRVGFFGFRTGLLLFAGGLLLAIASFTIGLVALIVPRLRGANPKAWLMIVAVSLALMAGPAVLVAKARGAPAIHDITTDTDHPPAFVDLIPLRQAALAVNPPEYSGSSVAVQQRRAYPDLAPLDMSIAPAEAFARAAAAARGMGWEIVAERPEEGRIEAIATTAWFGFKDDVVIRVAETGRGSRIDVRSKSRVGRSDVGANAARIRAYLALLRR
ncbi:MAG: DUF1499 domain-containing protein [Vicinamibacteria bacterium]|nr:DUF1499 domain-containing protein [Vicinamibacteria bacterium]